MTWKFARNDKLYMKNKNFELNNKGTTLLEVMVVMMLLVLLIIGVLAFFKPQEQIAKAKDAKRKNDLNELRKVFEDWYSDKGCYPKKAKFATTISLQPPVKFVLLKQPRPLLKHILRRSSATPNHRSKTISMKQMVTSTAPPPTSSILSFPQPMRRKTIPMTVPLFTLAAPLPRLATTIS